MGSRKPDMYPLVTTLSTMSSAWHLKNIHCWGNFHTDSVDTGTLATGQLGTGNFHIDTVDTGGVSTTLPST